MMYDFVLPTGLLILILIWFFYSKRKQTKSSLDAYVFVITEIISSGTLADNHLYDSYKKLVTSTARKKYALVLTIGFFLAIVLGLGIGIVGMLLVVPNILVWHLTPAAFLGIIYAILAGCVIIAVLFLHVLHRIKDDKFKPS